MVGNFLLWMLCLLRLLTMLAICALLHFPGRMCWVRAPELVDLFGITTRLILHRGFVQKLASPYAVGLSMRNYSGIY
jgi:hypothetical protein